MTVHLVDAEDLDALADLIVLQEMFRAREAIAVSRADVDEPNTYGLPVGDGIAQILKAWFAVQHKKVLAKIPQPGGAIPADLAELADDGAPMAAAIAPVLAVTWSKSGKTTYAQLGLDPDDWRVTSPHLKSKIEHAALAFCSSTNATTSKQLTDALRLLRASLIAGLTDEGATLAQLVKRVNTIFESAQKWRARRIAATEASRAVHAAQVQAAEDSGVVAGLEWLVSGDACPLCRKIAAEASRVKLGQPFAVVGHHPEYSKIHHPPLHPGCQCTVVEVLTPDVGGPANPKWAETLDQPKVPKDGYTPPLGTPEPQPNPAKAKAKPKPKAKPNPIPVPTPEPVSEPIPTPPVPAPVPVPTPAPAPKPEWPESLDGLAHVGSLGGSTGAQLVQDADGKRYVLKRGANPGHLREEATADALYRAIGLDVPQSKIYETPSGPAKLAEFVPGRSLAALKDADPPKYSAAVAKLKEGFAADALLGNWDVVGLSADNVLVTEDGRVLRIDNGGSLRYRAQGAPKGANWSTAVGELASLRSQAVNPSAKEVFGDLTDAQVVKQIKALAKKRAAILAAAPDDLKSTLAGRLDTMEAWAKLASPKSKGKGKGQAWTPSPASLFRRIPDAESDGWGRTHYAGWVAELTYAEKDAIKKYAGLGYQWMNKRLRTGALPDGRSAAEADAIINAAAAGLRKARLPEPIVVSRGIGKLSDMGLTLESLTPGSLVKEPAFVSTSTTRSPPLGTGVIFHIRLPAGAPAAYLNPLGVSHPSEKEVLLPPGAGRYRVVETMKDAGRTIVTMEWVPSDES